MKKKGEAVNYLQFALIRRIPATVIRLIGMIDVLALADVHEW